MFSRFTTTTTAATSEQCSFGHDEHKHRHESIDNVVYTIHTPLPRARKSHSHLGIWINSADADVGGGVVVVAHATLDVVQVDVLVDYSTITQNCRPKCRKGRAQDPRSRQLA